MKRFLIIICIGGAIVLFTSTWLLRMLAPDGFQHWKDVLEALSYIVILLGVPTGLVQYFQAVKKEQLDREYGTYNALDEKFLEFQNLCLAHPYLDIFDLPDKVPITLSPAQHKEELIAFTMLFSIFERAFLMYCDQAAPIKQRQWMGWDEYIQSYCKRGNFKLAWQTCGGTFDKDFEKYMTKFMPKLNNLD